MLAWLLFKCVYQTNIEKFSNISAPDSSAANFVHLFIINIIMVTKLNTQTEFFNTICTIMYVKTLLLKKVLNKLLPFEDGNLVRKIFTVVDP